MDIIRYNTEFKERLPVLIQESSIEYKDLYIENPEKVDRFVREMLGINRKTEEYLYMFACSTKNEILGLFEIAHGTIDSACASPREIFMKALLAGAAGIILVHNHPSQSVNPSKGDFTITERIKSAGNLIGIQLLDHIIIGNGFFSMRAEKCL